MTTVTRETLLETAEHMVNMMMVAYAEGRASLQVVVEQSGEPHLVLYVEGVPAAVLVLDPSKYPAPTTAVMQ